MKEVLLHIGMHKTGSSSIQASLKNYLDFTTRYASFKEENHSVPMYTIFSKHRYTYHIWKSIGLSKQEIQSKKEEYIKILEKDLNDASYERLIISGEDISLLDNEEKVQLVNFLQSHSVEVKLICLIRKPVSYATSALQEHIKAGLKNIIPVSPNYKFLLSTFSKLLPKENIIVRDFDAVVDEFGDVTIGFQHLIGLKGLNVIRINEGISAASIKLIYKLNNLPFNTFGSIEHMAARQKFIAVVTKLFPISNGPKLDPHVVKQIIGKNVNDDIIFLEEFGIKYNEIKDSDDLERVKKYIEDFSCLNVGLLRDKLSGEFGLNFSKDISIDAMIIAVYLKLKSENIMESFVNDIRDVALSVKPQGQLSLKDAYDIMLIAHKMRPNGPLIKKKLAEYSALLDSTA